LFFVFEKKERNRVEMSKIKDKKGRDRDDSNTNGSLSSSKKSATSKENLLSHSTSSDKKGMLASQSAHTKTSTRFKDTFRDSFNAKFGKKIEVKDSDEPSSGSSSGSAGGVTFASDDKKPNTKRTLHRREGSGLMILSPDRRRASKGPVINAAELLQLYKSKEATYAEQYANSALFPYKWIAPFETPKTECETLTASAVTTTPPTPPLVTTSSVTTASTKSEDSSPTIAPVVEKVSFRVSDSSLFFLTYVVKFH